LAASINLDYEITGYIYLLYDGPEIPQGIFDDFIALGAQFQQQTLSEYVISSSAVLGGFSTR
jgi:hypothetical protein